MFWVAVGHHDDDHRGLGLVKISTHLPLRIIHIDLIPKHNEREVLRIARRCLDEELVPPALQRLEGLG